jgi:hypothetical protein
MKLANIFLMIFFISNTCYAGEIWKWSSNIKKIQTFGGGLSSYICFTATGIDRSVCFDSKKPGAKEKYSLLLSAKLAKLPISISYIDNSSVSGLWFDNYIAHHIWLD